MSKQTGGPAFPFWSDTQHLAGYEGMSLRDYFAAKAMTSLLSDPDWRADMVWHETAYAAYQMADAMLKAREQ